MQQCAVGLLAVGLADHGERHLRKVEHPARKRQDILACDPVVGREQVKTTLLMGLESTGNRMMTIGRSELLRGEVSAVEQVLAAYDKVTMEDILSLARRVFDFSQVSLAVVGQPDREETYRALLQ